MEIKIASLLQGQATALVGKQNGRRFKEQLVQKFGELQVLESTNKVLIFQFPESVVTINSSFFLAVFSERIRLLGENQFADKYRFSASQHIQDKIQDHIKKALNASSMDDILDV